MDEFELEESEGLGGEPDTIPFTSRGSTLSNQRRQYNEARRGVRSGRTVRTTKFGDTGEAEEFTFDFSTDSAAAPTSYKDLVALERSAAGMSGRNQVWDFMDNVFQAVVKEDSINLAQFSVLAVTYTAAIAAALGMVLYEDHSPATKRQLYWWFHNTKVETVDAPVVLIGIIFASVGLAFSVAGAVLSHLFASMRVDKLKQAVGKASAQGDDKLVLDLTVNEAKQICTGSNLKFCLVVTKLLYEIGGYFMLGAIAGMTNIILLFSVIAMAIASTLILSDMTRPVSADVGGGKTKVVRGDSNWTWFVSVIVTFAPPVFLLVTYFRPFTKDSKTVDTGEHGLVYASVLTFAIVDLIMDAYFVLTERQFGSTWGVTTCFRWLPDKAIGLFREALTNETNRDAVLLARGRNTAKQQLRQLAQSNTGMEDTVNATWWLRMSHISGVVASLLTLLLAVIFASLSTWWKYKDRLPVWSHTGSEYDGNTFTFKVNWEYMHLLWFCSGGALFALISFSPAGTVMDASELTKRARGAVSGRPATMSYQIPWYLANMWDKFERNIWPSLQLGFNGAAAGFGAAFPLAILVGDSEFLLALSFAFITTLGTFLASRVNSGHASQTRFVVVSLCLLYWTPAWLTVSLFKSAWNGYTVDEAYNRATALTGIILLYLHAFFVTLTTWNYGEMSATKRAHFYSSALWTALLALAFVGAMGSAVVYVN